MKKVLLGCAGALVLLGALAFGGLMYIGTVGPETFVVSGKQLDKRFASRVQELGLLEEGETIQHFYSDAISDIAEGCYMLTDRHLILYSESWPDPKIIVPFDEIVSLEAEYNDSFFVDSYLTVGLAGGSDISFPVSSERGGDKRFFEYIDERRTRLEGGVLEAPEASNPG